jgi:hypothetical protein
MEDQWRDRPVDSLHALAAALSSFGRTARESALATLGVSLIALKSANRADEYVRSVDRLAHMLRKTKPKPNAELRIRISRQAVHEHIVDFCGTCQGRGEIPDQEGLEGAQRMKPCPECGGHGKRRYSDSERVELIGAPLRDVNRWMADAIALISEAESEAVRSASKLLGRW